MYPSEGNQPYRLIDYLTLSVLYGISSLLSFAGSSILSIFIFRQKKEMMELDSLEPLSPPQLFDLIGNRYRNQLIEMQNNQNPNYQTSIQRNLVKIPGKFIVKGEVYASNMIPSIDSKKQLIFGRISIDKLYLKANSLNQNIVQRRNELLDQKSIRSFELITPLDAPFSKNYRYSGKFQPQEMTEFESGKSKCLVTKFDTKETYIEKALRQIAYTEKINDTIKSSSRIQAGTMLVIGLTQNQVGIQIGDQLMVYGSVIFDLKTHVLLFEVPEIIAKRKYDIQEFVSKYFNLKSIASICLFSLGIFYANKSITSYIKHKKLQRERLLFNQQKNRPHQR